MMNISNQTISKTVVFHCSPPPRTVTLCVVSLVFLSGCSAEASRNYDNGLSAGKLVQQEFSSGDVGDFLFEVRVKNNSSQETAIVGMRSDCSCTHSDLPVTLPPGGEKILEVRVSGSSRPEGRDDFRKQICFVHQNSKTGLKVELVGIFRYFYWNE